MQRRRVKKARISGIIRRMNTVLLLVISAAPAIVFLVIILRMDRREPEPLRLVISVIGLGAAAAIVAGLLEKALGLLPVFHGAGLGAAALEAFLQVATVEEGCKLLVVLLFVWKNPNFNEENDGIVYVGAASIGFAVLENVLYVVGGGVGTGIVRAFTAVPLHVFTAVVMGLFVGRAKFAATQGRRVVLVISGFILAWFFHGLYDTIALFARQIGGFLLPLLAGLVSLGITSLKAGRRLSLRRWGSASPVPATGTEPHPHASRRHAPRRMAVIGRILLAASAFVWAFILINVSTQKTGTGAAATVVGGIVMTALPISLGIVLEHAYRKRRRQWKAAQPR
jgi:protease PrsW